MRRYARRYKVERTISWLQNFRRLVCRYERYPELFESFAVLGCLLITRKRFLELVLGKMVHPTDAS